MPSDTTITSSGLQNASSFYGVGGVKGKVTAEKAGIPLSTPSASIEDTVSLSSPDFLEKISHVQEFLEHISSSEAVLSTTINNVDAISAKLEEAGGIAIRIRDVLGSSISRELVEPQIEELQARFTKIISDIDNLAENSGFPSENLLAGDDISFAVDPSDRLSLDIDGLIVSSSQFGLDNAKFGTDEEAEFIKNIIFQAVDQIAVFKSQLNATSYELETRKAFSQDTIEVFLENAQKNNNYSSYEEASALEALISKTIANSDGSLALEAQFELLENFR